MEHVIVAAIESREEDSHYICLGHYDVLSIRNNNKNFVGTIKVGDGITRDVPLNRKSEGGCFLLCRVFDNKFQSITDKELKAVKDLSVFVTLNGNVTDKINGFEKSEDVELSFFEDLKGI